MSESSPRSAEEWFARMNAGAAPSPPDERAFRVWLQESPDNVAAYRDCQRVWLELGLASADARVLQLRAGALRSAVHAGRRRLLVGGLGVAAAAVGGLAVWRTDALTARRGERLTRSLPDGSLLTLAPMTRVRIAYDPTHRRIFLDRGQAYFDVAPEPSRPFEVVAGDLILTALGTRFQATLDDGGGVDVVLEEGRVSLARRGAKEPAVELAVGHSLRLAPKEGASSLQAVAVRPVDTAAASAWREGRLIFHDQTLAEVARAFNRYAAERIVVADAKAASVRISGSFRYEASGEFALALKDGFGLQVAQVDRSTWIVRSSGS